MASTETEMTSLLKTEHSPIRIQNEHPFVNKPYAEAYSNPVAQEQSQKEECKVIAIIILMVAALVIVSILPLMSHINQHCNSLPLKCTKGTFTPSDTFHNTDCGQAITRLKRSGQTTPPVNCYFDADQIQQHLDQFASASFITRETALLHYNFATCDPTLSADLCEQATAYVGRKEAQFVITKQSMDDVISNLRLEKTISDKSDNDLWLQLVDKPLGFAWDTSFINPDNDPNTTVIQIDIPNAQRFKLRMADGNENGAFQNEWIPGGYLPTGTPEAVLDQVMKSEVMDCMYIIYQNGQVMENNVKYNAPIHGSYAAESHATQMYILPMVVVVYLALILFTIQQSKFKFTKPL
eukprot:50272_1